MSDPGPATIIQSIASGVGTAFIIYISVTVRKGVRKFVSEHQWLMTTTRKMQEEHDWLIKQVGENTRDIKRMLELQERREKRRP